MVMPFDRVTDSVAVPFDVILPHPSVPEKFVTAARDGMLRVWDLNTYRQTQVLATDFKSQTVHCTGLCIADGLEIQLSSWTDGCVRCHDLTDAKLLWTLPKAHRSAITAICLSPSLKYFVTGGSDGDVIMWDIRSRQQRLSLKDHSQDVVHLQLFDDDKHLLSASKDRIVCAWDLSTGKRVTAHEAHQGPLTSALLGRNQSEVYTAGMDHRINVFDLRYREPIRATSYCPPGTEAYATKIRRSVDERMLVTGGNDQLVKLWDPRKLTLLSTGLGHSGTVVDCAFTCDNKQVVSCGQEGSIMVWNIYA
jgi:WD40 repeat protein